MKARLRFVLPAVLAAVACAAPASNAGLLDPITQLVLPTCGINSYPFAQFGDKHAYFGFANNGFENGSTNWSFSGAGIAKDNEPWFVNGYGRYALALPPGASATSPGFCINLLDPAIRMFAKSVSANGDLKVQVLFRGITGNLTGVLNVDSLSPDGYGDWAPGDRVNSLLAVPILTSYAQIRITSAATRGLWEVDDVFVDPCISRIG
jgi:hypothetical protein